jgi:ABC-type amino acid transport substrate-binding protein
MLLACTTPGGIGGRALRVGVSPSYPPVVFERDDEIVGIEADLARKAGEALNRRIVFERYEFPELIDALERGEVDVVMSGLSITPERAQRVLFTEPYMQVGQLALIRSADVGRLGRIQTIHRSGVRIGYERGTTGERFVANELPRSTSFGFESVDEGLRSLRAGRIDYFIHDAPTVWLVAGDPRQADLLGLYQPLTEEYLAWAVRPDDTALRHALDGVLEDWKREGLLDPILDRWIPVRVTVR